MLNSMNREFNGFDSCLYKADRLSLSILSIFDGS